jgi:hypothetical protein
MWVYASCCLVYDDGCWWRVCVCRGNFSASLRYDVGLLYDPMLLGCGCVRCDALQRPSDVV